MKIKTVTCQHVYNYGATLQAYALQEFLESDGNDVDIIDYRLPLHIRYELFTPFPEGRVYNLICKFPFLRYLITPIKNRKMLKTWGRKKAFDRFDKTYLHLTKETYRSYESLRDCNIDADVLIAGSDQIWNPEYENGTDLGYYLDFGQSDLKRISYAASFGVSEISEKQAAFVKKELAKFSSISVRECDGVRILQNIGIPAVQCVDPVFLLSSQEWIKLLQLKLKKHKYVLVYDFNHDNAKMESFVLTLAKSKGLKIIAINDADNTPYADVQINNAGPKEFLEYLLNAEYVVGTSFHATAFSLIFNKNFATFPLKGLSNSSRMLSLLQKLDLRDRFDVDDVSVMDKLINWEKKNEILFEDSQRSKDYLINAINN